jgi:hypothetical protein
MSIPTPPTNSHPARRARTMGDLLEAIADALGADDWAVEHGTLDTQGMTVVDSRTGCLYRLELADDGMLDDADWRHRVLSTRPAMLVKTGMSHPKVGLNGYAVDPAGFNGMEVHND